MRTHGVFMVARMSIGVGVDFILCGHCGPLGLCSQTATLVTTIKRTELDQASLCSCFPRDGATATVYLRSTKGVQDSHSKLLTQVQTHQFDHQEQVIIILGLLTMA
jgi:hypothetical protein